MSRRWPDADLGGVARAVGWRQVNRNPLDDKTRWMGYLADQALARSQAVAARVAELGEGGDRRGRG